MPTQLTRAEVLRIAELARLHLSDDEAGAFARQLTSILDYAASIQNVQTAGVRTASEAPSSTPELRDDGPSVCLDHSLTVAQAPDASEDGSLFRVPKVL